MTSLQMEKHSSYLRHQREDAREYRLIFCLIYPQLLVVAIVSRLYRLMSGRPSSSSEPRRSVFSEARISAASCIPFVFK